MSIDLTSTYYKKCVEIINSKIPDIILTLFYNKDFKKYQLKNLFRMRRKEDAKKFNRLFKILIKYNIIIKSNRADVHSGLCYRFTLREKDGFYGILLKIYEKKECGIIKEKIKQIININEDNLW